MPRRRHLFLALLLLLAGAVAASAHPLNWTKLTFAAAGDDPAAVVARLEVDLANYVSGYDAYFALAADPARDTELRAAVLQAWAEVIVSATPGGPPLRWTLEEFVPPPPDDEFFAPLPAPMAFARLRATSPVSGDSLHVTVAPTTRLELPLVVRVTHAGEDAAMPLLLSAGSAPAPLAWLTAPPTTPDAPAPARLAPPTAWRTLLTYGGQGFLHILPHGPDHVLFVLALFLGGAAPRALIGQLSLFTLAHTLTLGAATLGWVVVPGRVVEPLIAASIAWLAIENLRGHRPAASARWVVIFACGLLHGLGFAGALADLGLPRHGLLPALLGFNLGVELGQIAVVAGAFLLVGWWRQARHYRRAVVLPASAAMAALAGWWTCARLVG